MSVNSFIGGILMKKADLVAQIADYAGISKKDAEAALAGFMDAVEGALKKGDSVQLVGFGTFMVSKRKATTGRNPKTGEPIQIPARNAVRFKVGKKLSDAIN
jgi:DNA-binding protein HU-beta